MAAKNLDNNQILKICRRTQELIAAMSNTNILAMLELFQLTMVT